MIVFKEVKKKIKFVWKPKVCDKLETERTYKAIILSDPKLYYKALVTKTAWHCHTHKKMYILVVHNREPRNKVK